MSSIDGTNSIFANTIDGLTNIDTNTITINGQTTDQLYMRNDQSNNSFITNNLNMGPFGVEASTFTDSTFTGNKALISDGSKKIEESTTSSTELGYLSGTTSNIQTQLNNRALTSRFNAGDYVAPTSQGVWLGWNRLGTGLLHLGVQKGLGDGGVSIDNYSVTNTYINSPLVINCGSQTTTHLYPWNNGNQKITTTYTATNNEDLTNKAYVDGLIGSYVTTNTAQDISAVKTFTGVGSVVSASFNRFPVAKFTYDGSSFDYLEIQADLFKATVLGYLPLALNRLGGNVSIGKVPDPSSGFKLDVNGGVQCGALNSTAVTYLCNNGGRYLEVDSAPNLMYIDFHSSGTSSSFDARILCGGGGSIDAQGTMEIQALQTQIIGGKANINTTGSGVQFGALNVRGLAVADPSIFGGFAGGLTLQSNNPATGWDSSNSIDFIQNFAGGNGQWKIYPRLDSATGSVGQLRFKLFQSGTFPNYGANELLILQCNTSGSSRQVGINCEPNPAYGLDVVNDTIRCNDLYHVNMAYGDYFNYGVAQGCGAGVQNELIFAGSNGSFGITRFPFGVGDAFIVNKIGVYEFTFSCWCLPFGPTQAIFSLRDTATGTVRKRLALIIDPANGSTVSFSAIITTTSPNAYYVEVTPGAANINVFDRNLTIKLIKFQ